VHARLRRLLTAALVMSALAVLGTAIAVTVALNTNWGRELTTRRVRAMLTQQLAPGTQVEMHGLFLTPLGTVRLDSLVLRDPDAVFEELQAHAEPGFCDHSFVHLRNATATHPAR
jgi:hypothetical protein